MVNFILTLTNMMNKVEVIGLCVDVNTTYIILKVENGSDLKLFFNESIDINAIEIGKYTKVIGFLDASDFPFPIVKIEKVYQLKETVH